MKIDKNILKSLILVNIKQMFSAYNHELDYKINIKLDKENENILIFTKKEREIQSNNVYLAKDKIEELNVISCWKFFAEYLHSNLVPYNQKHIEQLSKDINIEFIRGDEIETDRTYRVVTYRVTYITIPIEKIINRILSHPDVKPLKEYKSIFKFINFDEQKEYQALINVQLLSNMLPNNNEEVAKPKL